MSAFKTLQRRPDQVLAIEWDGAEDTFEAMRMVLGDAMKAGPLGSEYLIVQRGIYPTSVGVGQWVVVYVQSGLFDVMTRGELQWQFEEKGGG